MKNNKILPFLMMASAMADGLPSRRIGVDPVDSLDDKPYLPIPNEAIKRRMERRRLRLEKNPNPLCDYREKTK